MTPSSIYILVWRGVRAMVSQSEQFHQDLRFPQIKTGIMRLGPWGGRARGNKAIRGEVVQQSEEWAAVGVRYADGRFNLVRSR